jgi:hypothetical protein
MEAFHAELQQPLFTALVDLGEARPQQVAELINSLVIQVSRSFEDGGPDTEPMNEEAALSLLRRLLGGYLGLSAA